MPSLTKKNLFGAVGEDVEAAVFVPVRSGRRVAEGFVFEDFYGYVAEGLVRRIADYMGEGGGSEGGLTVLEVDGYGRLVFDGVDDLGVPRVT